MENNGKGIFYGVIGVATLIVAIIGATFAYFTATASNETTIQGNAASVGLKLDIVHVSTAANKGLVPQKEAALSSAMKGVDSTAGADDACVDANGNTVCQVYKITVQNTGTAEAKLNGTLDLTKNSVTNLKWAIVSDFDSNPTTSTPSGSSLGESVTLGASASQEYYVVIWINETDAPQEDSGNFTGTVAFNAADGSGVTSTFTV